MKEVLLVLVIVTRAMTEGEQYLYRIGYTEKYYQQPTNIGIKVGITGLNTLTVNTNHTDRYTLRRMIKYFNRL